MTPIKTASILIILLLLLFISTIFYTVNTGQQAIVLRLGKPLMDNTQHIIVQQPGLHFKIPFVDHVNKINMQLQSSVAATPPLTLSKGDSVILEYYLKWRITDLFAYYHTYGENNNDALAALKEAFQKNLLAAMSAKNLTETTVLNNDETMSMLKTKTNNEKLQQSGINLVDAKVKNIILSETQVKSIFEAMQEERALEANKYRANGQLQATIIRARADADKREILAKAHEDAKEIRAKGVMEAGQIYVTAYNNSPDFFAFYRRMKAYKTIFSQQNDILVLQPAGDFFKYFNSLNAQNNEGHQKGS